MTFSIVAHSAGEEAWGVAVATKWLAVGAMVPAAEWRVGALATQAQTNMSYREAGLAMLNEGASGKDVVTALLHSDEQPETRQVGIVDRHGVAATWTGDQCLPFAGDYAGDGYAVLGNLLNCPEVLDAMQTAWLRSDLATPLPDRLLAALDAGDAAGGDRRGRQSAALYVVGSGGALGFGSHVQVDLRVDDAQQPIGELWRLLRLRRDADYAP